MAEYSFVGEASQGGRAWVAACRRAVLSAGLRVSYIEEEADILGQLDGKVGMGGCSTGIGLAI